MTVETDTSRAQYATNGTTGPWSVPFYFLADGDLRVVYADADGNESELTLTTHYSVTGAEDPAGGSITTVTAYASGGTITILRDVAALQPTDYANTDAFPAETLERNLDRLTMLAQQSLELFGRSVTVPVSDTTSLELPTAAQRASRILAFDAEGQPIAVVGVDSSSATALSLDLASGDVSKGDALIAVKTTQSGSAATTLHAWNEAQTLNSAANFSIPADGTDQTSALVSLLGTLTAYRGQLEIAKGTAFDEQAVAAAIPLGLRVNWLTDWVDGSYKQKFRVSFNGDNVSDDSQDVEASHYHPTRALWNTGKNTTDKSDSAARRYASDAHWVGYSSDFNGPVIGWFEQYAKHPDLNRWRKSWRIQTKLAIAMGDTHGKWITAKPFVTGEQVRNSTGAIYRATNTATSGATEPTGTGSSISDGAVTWAYVQPASVPTLRTASAVYGLGARVLADNYKVYVATTGGTASSGSGPTGTGTGIADGTIVWDYEQAALAVDQTRMDLDENGNVGMYAPAGATQRLTMQSGAQSQYLEVSDATGDALWRDETRGVDVLRSSTANGVRLGRIQSMDAATVNVTATGSVAVTSAVTFLTTTGGPWEISNLTLPSGQTSGRITLWFSNANLVLKNNANIVTRTGADITSAANMMVTLYKDTAISAAWVVWAKN